MNPIKIIGILVLIVGVVFILGTLFMTLWNWVMPAVFGINEITFLQGFALIILSKILLGGVEANKGDSASSNRTYTRYGPVTVKRNIEENTEASVVEEQQSLDTREVLLETETADELYEKWWSEEGEAYFDEYLTQNQD